MLSVVRAIIFQSFYHVVLEHTISILEGCIYLSVCIRSSYGKDTNRERALINFSVWGDIVNCNYLTPSRSWREEEREKKRERIEVTSERNAKISCVIARMLSCTLPIGPIR